MNFNLFDLLSVNELWLLLLVQENKSKQTNKHTYGKNLSSLPDTSPVTLLSPLWLWHRLHSIPFQRNAGDRAQALSLLLSGSSVVSSIGCSHTSFLVAPSRSYLVLPWGSHTTLVAGFATAFLLLCCPSFPQVFLLSPLLMLGCLSSPGAMLQFFFFFLQVDFIEDSYQEDFWDGSNKATGSWDPSPYCFVASDPVCLAPVSSPATLPLATQTVGTALVLMGWEAGKGGSWKGQQEGKANLGGTV